MKNQSQLILAFIVGAAAGAAVAYLVTSDKGEEIIEEIRDLAGKIRENVNDRISKTESENESEANEAEDFMGV